MTAYQLITRGIKIFALNFLTICAGYGMEVELNPNDNGNSHKQPTHEPHPDEEMETDDGSVTEENKTEQAPTNGLRSAEKRLFSRQERAEAKRREQK